jgi:drug/metabolite transporter (DMT)-like permease
MFSVHKNGVTIGISAALTNVFFWGVASPIIKSALDVISPYVFLYYRFLIVIILTTPVLFFMRKKFNTMRNSRHLLELLGVGVLTHPLSLGLLFIGLQFTTTKTLTRALQI